MDLLLKDLANLNIEHYPKIVNVHFAILMKHKSPMNYQQVYRLFLWYFNKAKETNSDWHEIKSKHPIIKDVEKWLEGYYYTPTINGIPKKIY